MEEIKLSDVASISVGSAFVLGLSSLPTVSMAPFLPIIGVGGLGIASLYGAYRIATNDKRKYRQYIKEEKEKFDMFWEGVGIKNKTNQTPQLTNIWETDNGHIYSFINPIGSSTKDYENKEIAIKEFLGCKNVLFDIKNDFLNIQTIETELPTIIPFVLPIRKSDELIVELGVNELGEKVKINFNKIHSWLLAGATGSGKSVCTHNILTQLYCNYSDVTEFYICDMKKTELNNYRNLKSTIKYTDKIEEVEQVIDELLKICDERHELFIRHNVKNLQQYNRKVKFNKLPNIVLCIEEAVRLMNNKVLQNKIAELCFIARSAGTIVLITIQRATKNLLSPDIKASLLGKIGFKTVNKINSQVIMDDNRLFELKNSGECYISCEDVSVGEIKAKVMYLQENKIDNILKEKCLYK